jgi:predicted TPR repeat methyltransferase
MILADESQAMVVEDQEMTFLEALNLASQLHRGCQLEAAEMLYRNLLAGWPQEPNSMHYLGVLLCQSGRIEEGLPMIRQSIESDSGVAAWHNNLGNVMLDAGRFDEASQAYQRCLTVDPSQVDVLNNLGVLQTRLGHLPDAESTLLQAVARNPDFAAAHYNLASLCFSQRRFDEGFAHSANALSLEPRHRGTLQLLGLAYARMGRNDLAAAIYREWLSLEPDSALARHQLAGCSGEQVPDRASATYVEEVFDSFAKSFDAKLQSLDYCAPQLVGEAVGGLFQLANKSLAVLDAGCGTGLCGPWLIPYAQRLVGVDLSQAMLERAAQRDIYHELVKADLVAFLQSQEPVFDLVASADTFCYFGRLDQAFQGAANALRADGVLCFTVEAHEDVERPGYWLYPHGRYSHHRSFVESELLQAGFGPPQFSSVVLRQECGVPVAGWLVSARRLSSHVDLIANGKKDG